MLRRKKKNIQQQNKNKNNWQQHTESNTHGKSSKKASESSGNKPTQACLRSLSPSLSLFSSLSLCDFSRDLFAVQIVQYKLNRVCAYDLDITYTSQMYRFGSVLAIGVAAAAVALAIVICMVVCLFV